MCFLRLLKNQNNTLLHDIQENKERACCLFHRQQAFEKVSQALMNF